MGQNKFKNTVQIIAFLFLNDSGFEQIYWKSFFIFFYEFTLTKLKIIRNYYLINEKIRYILYNIYDFPISHIRRYWRKGNLAVCNLMRCDYNDISIL